MPSQNTITDAIRDWENANWPHYDRFEHIRKAQGKELSHGASGGQSYLEGAQYRFSDGERGWLNGHITLSPGKAGLGHCGSFHLTITGGSNHAGNYFFELNEHGEVSTSGAPVGFKGKSSRNGSELPGSLSDEVMELVNEILNE